jgi:hypothetical protein
MSCQFPLCKSNAIPGKIYCIGHNKHFGSVVIAEAKPINKVSSAMAAVKRELKKLYPIFLKKHPKCQIKSPVCTKKSTCIHHKKGRGKNEILDQGTWMASCEHCNSYVEQEHAWAEKNGFKVSRHKVESK